MSVLGRLALLVGLATALPLTSKGDSDIAINDTIISDSTLEARASSSSWWFPNIDYSNSDWANYAPNLDNNNYPVYVSVSDANGLTNAIASNNRPNGDLAAQPRVIYIAPGTYTLSSTLYLYTDTVLIGDAANPPTIRASSGFSGSQLIAGGKDQNDSGNGGELKFSTMIKNVILDTTANSGQKQFTALSWRVAQNSGLVNVVINLPSGAHTGMTVGQGSTIQIGDVTFNNGNIGLEYDGSQQATLKNLSFNRCTTGISITGGNTINIFHPTFNTVGFSIVLQDGVGAWVSVVDGTTTNSGTFFTSYNKYPNFMLENIVADSSKNAVVVVGGNTKVSGRTRTGTYVYGNTVGANPIYQTNNQPVSINRPSALTVGSNSFYPVVTANQYPNARVSDVINLKNPNQNGGVKLKGDGSTNDGPALQSALNYAAQQNKIAFLPYGVYRTLQTITIPSGTELVGNGWSTISGYGSAFTDPSNPAPVVQIGNPGDVGTAHIQDIRFTIGQRLPGAILLQVHLAGSSPGAVSISNSLLTIGGLPDTEISCSSNSAPCRAAYLGLHLASTSSAYIDNFWAWVADHASDGSSGGVHMAAKGGVLIEATKGTWLAGLGAEHFWLYQVAFNSARNVFVSLLQSESNYQQGNGADTQLPGPYTSASLTSSDPDFSWCSADGKGGSCYKSVAQWFSKNQSGGIREYAAGSWNFEQFGGDQDYMNVMASVPSDSDFYGLTAHDTTKVMRLPDGSSFGDSQHYGGSWGNLVADYSP